MVAVAIAIGDGSRWFPGLFVFERGARPYGLVDVWMWWSFRMTGLALERYRASCWAANTVCTLFMQTWLGIFFICFTSATLMVEVRLVVESVKYPCPMQVA